jgi:Uma2 family endonuclease
MSTGAVIFEDQLRVPMDVFELDKFRAWAHSDDYPETGKIAFIDGDIEVDMSPEELSSHNRVKRDISTDLNVIVRESDFGELLVDGAFLVNKAARLATEPDLMYCSWEAIRTGRVVYAPWVEGSDRLVEVRGSPDLVCEIVSKGSVRKDTVRLRKTYFEAGIPEYWLIDARGKTLSFQILVRSDLEYIAVVPDARGYLLSQVFQRRFRLVSRQNPVGGACYRLLTVKQPGQKAEPKSKKKKFDRG